MKKYTQPTVEITAFDFEDIMDTSSGTSNSLGAGSYDTNIANYNAPADVVVVKW